MSEPETGYSINLVDKHGLWLESVFDAGCLLWSIDEFRKDPSWENFGWVMADVGALALPIVPAISGIVRAGKIADKAMDAGRAFERTGDFYTVRGAEGLEDLLRSMKKGDPPVRVRSTEDIMVFRTYSGHEGNYMETARRIHGGSWSTINPRSISSTKWVDLHGIPVTKNAPNFIAFGKIPSGTEFYFRKALRIGDAPGGGPDILNWVDSIDILKWGVPY